MFNCQISLVTSVLNNKIDIFNKGRLRAFNVICTMNLHGGREVLQPFGVSQTLTMEHFFFPFAIVPNNLKEIVSFN